MCYTVETTIMVYVKQASVETHTRAHTISHPRAFLNLSLEFGSRTCVCSQHPNCLGLKISPISQKGCGEPLSLGPSSWNLAWAFHPRFRGLMTEELTEPRKENVTVPGVVEGERQRKKSTDSQEGVPGVAKPFPSRLSPLFPPHLCKP